VDELKSGRDLYFVQRDNRSSGDVIYRMRVEELSVDRFVITIENVSTVWLLVFPIFAAGDLESTYILQRLSPNVWGYYSLWGVRAGQIADGQEASYVNRAKAIYHHIVRTPDSVAPPH
jgi:hypothetical protein